MDIFLALAMIGLAVFVLGFLFEGLELEIGGDIPVLQTVAVFMGTAGGTGLIVRSLGLTGSLALGLVSAAAAFVLTVAFVLFYRWIKSLDDEGLKESHSTLVGRTAVVSWWHESTGEVVATFNGQRHKLTAVLPENLRYSTPVAGDSVYIMEPVRSAAKAGIEAVVVAPIGSADSTAGS